MGPLSIAACVGLAVALGVLALDATDREHRGWPWWLHAVDVAFWIAVLGATAWLE